MRKRAIAAAALLGLGACLENPGVATDLAERHDRLRADFHVGDVSVRLRLERTASGTELYLANRSDRPIDSLEFFAQISDYASSFYAGGIGSGYPVFDDAPIAEYNGRVIGLQNGMEADLGPLAGAFPRNLDETGVVFICLGQDTLANPFVNNRIGYYSGSFTARDSLGLNVAGTLRGVVSYWGMHFWMRKGNREWGALNGSMRGDSVTGIEFTDADSYAMLNSITLAVPLNARADDSIEFAVTLRGKLQPANPMDLKVTLSRSESRRWAPAAPGDASNHIPPDPPEARP